MLLEDKMAEKYLNFYINSEINRYNISLNSIMDNYIFKIENIPMKSSFETQTGESPSTSCNLLSYGEPDVLPKIC